MDNSGHPASYYLPKSSNPLVLDSQGKIYEGLQNRGQFIEVQKKIALPIPISPLNKGEQRIRAQRDGGRRHSPEGWGMGRGEGEFE